MMDSLAVQISQKDQPLLSEIEHLRGKVTDEQLEAIKDILERNEDVFSRHKADIGCCNFVEHEIELEESAVPHREGARRMTPHKSDACTKEIETLLEYDMIEPSKSPWACGVVMAKKRRPIEVLLRLSVSELRHGEGCLSHT